MGGTLARRVMWLASAKAVAFALGFALPLILVRSLSQTEFGLYKQVFLLLNTAITILPLGFAIPFISPVVRAAIVLTVSTAAGALTLPVVYLCIVLLYFDLRIRREHFDLDQLARQAVPPSAPG